MTSDSPSGASSAAPTSARAVLAGHADFAAGMASAVAQISGRDDVFVLMTNRGRSGEDIERDLRAAIDAAGVRVVFTDLPGGSCTLAARRLQRERPELVLVTGANLATLLDFAFAAGDDENPAAAALSAAQAAEKGRAALAVVPTRPAAEGARGAA